MAFGDGRQKQPAYLSFNSTNNSYDIVTDSGAVVMAGDDLGALIGRRQFNSARPALELTVGNSLGAPNQGFYGAAPVPSFVANSSHAFSQMLWPISCYNKRITAVAAPSNIDVLGNYGYSSQTIATILADLTATCFPTWDSNGLVPDIIFLSGIFENEASTDVPTATTEKGFIALMRALRFKFQNATIKVNTPHPDVRCSTAARKAAFLQNRQLALNADDDKMVFVTDLSGPGSYADPNDITQPLAGYTSDGTHPNGTGGSVVGRLVSVTNRRISPRLPCWNKPVRGQDLIGLGAAAQAANNVTGTRWTEMTFPTPASGSAVCTAGNPGTQQVVWTPAAAGGTILCRLNGLVFPTLLTTPIALWMTMRINSGSQYIRSIQGRLQATGTPATSDNVNISIPGGVEQQIYRDSDFLTFLTPAQPQPATTVTGILPSVNLIANVGGNPIDFEIFNAGYIDMA